MALQAVKPASNKRVSLLRFKLSLKICYLNSAKVESGRLRTGQRGHNNKRRPGYPMGGRFQEPAELCIPEF